MKSGSKQILNSLNGIARIGWCRRGRDHMDIQLTEQSVPITTDVVSSNRYIDGHIRQ